MHRVLHERINPKITIISDSICGRITISADFRVISGLNIDRCYEYIKWGGGAIKMSGYDIVILDIGTVERKCRKLCS